jgi:hypothetical protein
MSLAGTSEMLRNPTAPPVSEMKAIEHLELVEGILLAPQALVGMPWHEQPFRMLTSEVRTREGEEAAKLLEEIVAPVRLRIGGATEGATGAGLRIEAGDGKGEQIEFSRRQLPSAPVAATNQATSSSAVEAAAATAVPAASSIEPSSSSITGSSGDALVSSSDALTRSEGMIAVAQRQHVSEKELSVMTGKEKKELLERDKYESRVLAPITDEITPELMHGIAAIAERAEKKKGVLRFQHPEPSTHVTDFLGPGTQVVAARQFEALGRAGLMTTYARYSNFPHPPKRLDQLPDDLVADHQLRPEEEEAVARTIIHKQLNEGKIAPETVLNYLHKSSSVAGMAAQVATTWMESTEERRKLFAEFSLFLALLFALVCCALATLAAYIRYHQVFGTDDTSKKRKKQQYLNLETMLPWWGNDAQYETSVKRIFLEEYKKGRQAAEQMKNYQRGLEQETLSPQQKKDLELSAFVVSAADVQRMRQRVKETHAIHPDEPKEDEEVA